jgi:hypothetical protein
MPEKNKTSSKEPVWSEQIIISSQEYSTDMLKANNENDEAQQ